MATTFAIRGDSLDARFSSAGKSPGQAGLRDIVVSSDQAGINGSTSLDFAGSFATRRALLYAGRENTPSGLNRSVLIRFKAASVSINCALFYLGGFFELEVNALFAYVNTSGEIVVGVSNEVGQTDTGTTTGANITDIANDAGSTLWHDLLVTWDGTSGANGLNVYVDGTNRLTDTMTRALPSPYNTVDRRACSNILLGTAGGISFTHCFIDEFVVSDQILTPSVTLESGAGTLNGNARNSYYAVDAFDGQNNTWPAENKVEEGTTWFESGVQNTGTLSLDAPTLPDANDVRFGVVYGPDNEPITGELNTALSNASKVKVSDNNIKVKVS